MKENMMKRSFSVDWKSKFHLFNKGILGITLLGQYNKDQPKRIIAARCFGRSREAFVPI